jgi:hypothetical protein
MKNTSNSNCKIQSRQQISICHFSCLTGSCKKVLCAVLIICPWYEMTQKERGEQARHNTVYVIYMSYDNQSLAPVNQHVLGLYLKFGLIQDSVLCRVLFRLDSWYMNGMMYVIWHMNDITWYDIQCMNLIRT